jgi:hypothetical protein
MAVRQGGKYYAQILLDVHRYQLIEQLAEKEGVRPTALIRRFAYEGLQRSVPPADYSAAEDADQALWATSVQRRVLGRLRAKDTDA